MKKIILIMAYYGTLPNFFPVWLESVKNNPTIDFCFFSDCIDNNLVPENVKVVNISGEEFKNRIKDRFDFEVSINNYGRISQFRPAFAYIFPEVVESYDFWGYVECDLILGDIRRFITDELLEQYDKFFKLGHLQLFRNCKEMNTLFMQKTPAALNYKYAYSKDVLFFEEIFGMTNIADAKGVRTYKKNVFSDLNMFELMFIRGTFTYNELSPQEQLFEYSHGKLYSYAISQGNLVKKEILYVHFQKRAMDVDTSDYNKYVIVPNKFDKWTTIDKSFFNKIRKEVATRAEDYRTMMVNKLQDIKKQRLKTWDWRILYLIRLRVFICGGIDLSGKKLKEALKRKREGSYRMKVCYVLSTSEITGGANQSILDLLGALDRDTVDPIVLIKKHGDIEERLRKLDIPTYLIPFINEVSTGNPILDLIKRINAVKTTKQVERFLRDNHVEILHNNSLPTLAGMEAANKLGIPYICHIREQVTSGLGLQLLNEKKHFDIVKKAACILAISKFACEEYKNSLQDVDIKILHDGFDIYKYLDENKEIFNNDEVNIAIYGNLDPQKGQLDAVKAIEILQNRIKKKISLHIIGNLETKYADEVRNYVAEKNLHNIYFNKPIKDSKTLKESRAEMDINLVCSSAEGLGRVTIESMLSGCLTIGADAGATTEILTDRKNGLTFEVHNYEKLSEVIEWSLLNSSEARVIASLGRKYAKENFSVETYALEIQSIYKRILFDNEEVLDEY